MQQQEQQGDKMTKGNQCGKEAEIATITTKQRNMEKVLFGNGSDGVVKKIEKIKETLIELKGYNALKIWILRGTVALLLLICGFLASYVWYMHFGGN